MAKAIILIPKYAYASGRDTGNRSMRKSGRKKWNAEDWNVAARVTNRLLVHALDLPPELAKKILAECGAE